MIELRKVLPELRSRCDECPWSDPDDRRLVPFLNDIDRKIRDVDELMHKLLDFRLGRVRNPELLDFRLQDDRVRNPEWARARDTLKEFQGLTSDLARLSQVVLEYLWSVMNGYASVPKSRDIKFTIGDHCRLIHYLARGEGTFGNRVSTFGISDMMKVASIADDARKALLLAAGGIAELSRLLVVDFHGDLVTALASVALLMEGLRLESKQMDANHQSQTPPMPMHPRRTSMGFQNSTLLLGRETARNHRIPYVAANRTDIGNDFGDDDGLGSTERYPSYEELQFRRDDLDADGRPLTSGPHVPTYATRPFSGSRRT